MDLGIKEKHALVMASSRGLGLAVGEALAAEGANVILTGRSGGQLQEASERINARGEGSASFYVADMSDAGSIDTVEAHVRERFGSLDILVNNTAGPPFGQLTEMASAEFGRQFELMVTRPIELTRRFLPDMRQRQWGRVLTIASSGVIQPIPNLGLSNTLRSALVGWSKTMANETAGDGITFNLLLPGRIATDRTRELDKANAKRENLPVRTIEARSAAAIPAGRYGEVAEFGAVAAFLVSQRASYITGSLIRCDGGSIRSV